MINPDSIQKTRFLKGSYSKFSHFRAISYWKKLKVFAKVIGRFQVLSKHIILYGSDFPRNLSVSDKNFKLGDKKRINWVFNPKSKFKKIWDFLVVVLLLYTSIFLPYQMAFDEYINETWEAIDDFSDVFFMVDIVINFNTAILLNNGTLNYERKEIVYRYLKSWFFIDFISSFPLKRLSQFSGEKRTSSFNKFLRFLKINRIYRISKFFKILKSLKITHKSSNFVAILSMLFYFLTTLILSIHILSCIWYHIYKINPDKYNSWNFQYFYENNQYMYLVCIYYVFTTMTTVGYGDIVPVSNQEKLFAMSLMMFGAVFYSIMVSCMINILTRKARSDQILSDKVQVLKELSAYCKIDSTLYKKIKYSLNIQSVKTCPCFFDIYDQILIFPPSLKNDIFECLYKNLINDILFFKSKPKHFSYSIIPLLNLSIYHLHQAIYVENEVADEVYFIKSGNVNIEIRGILVRVGEKGDYFGECELLEGCLRISSAVTSSKIAEIFTLSKKEFLKALEEFPEVKDDIWSTSKLRHKNCEGTKSTIRTVSGTQQSETRDLDPEMLRIDTAFAVSLMRNDSAKKQNRTIWAVANGKELPNKKPSQLLSKHRSMSSKDFRPDNSKKIHKRIRLLSDGFISNPKFSQRFLQD